MTLPGELPSVHRDGRPVVPESHHPGDYWDSQQLTKDMGFDTWGHERQENVDQLSGQQGVSDWQQALWREINKQPAFPGGVGAAGRARAAGAAAAGAAGRAAKGLVSVVGAARRVVSRREGGESGDAAAA